MALRFQMDDLQENSDKFKEHFQEFLEGKIKNLYGHSIILNMNLTTYSSCILIPESALRQDASLMVSI